MKRKLSISQIILLVILLFLIFGHFKNSGYYDLFVTKANNYFRHNAKAKILWFKLVNDVSVEPIVTNNYFITFLNLNLTCFNKFSGRKIWNYTANSFYYSDCIFKVYKNNLLIMPANDRDAEILAVDVDSGNRVWNTKLDTKIQSAFFTQSCDKIFAATYKSVYIIDSLSGKIVKKWYFNDAVIKSITGDESEIFILFKNGSIKRMNLKNEKIEDIIKLKSSATSGFYFNDKVLYVVVEHKIIAIKQGKILWRKNVGNNDHFGFYDKYLKCYSISSGSDFPCYFFELLILNKETGKEVLTGNFTNIDCDTLDENNTVFLAEQNKYGYFNIESKKYIWENALPQKIELMSSSYDKQNKMIFLMINYRNNSKNRDIYAVNALNGNILWKYSVSSDFKYSLVEDKTIYFFTYQKIMVISGK